MYKAVTAAVNVILPRLRRGPLRCSCAGVAARVSIRVTYPFIEEGQTKL